MHRNVGVSSQNVAMFSREFTVAIQAKIKSPSFIIVNVRGNRMRTKVSEQKEQKRSRYVYLLIIPWSKVHLVR